MAKIKLTKTELKAQQDALKQFKRFLPTLQLKKQQLQMELRSASERLNANEAEFQQRQNALKVWAGLYGDPEISRLAAGRLRLTSVKRGFTNIAGVTVPIYEGAEFELENPDYFRDPFALLRALPELKRQLELRLAREILQEQYALLQQELTTTSQRVNLFEKIKIPECLDNIRRIGIALGDQNTAAVVRSKIAKKKSEQVTSEELVEKGDAA